MCDGGDRQVKAILVVVVLLICMSYIGSPVKMKSVLSAIVSTAALMLARSGVLRSPQMQQLGNFSDTRFAVGTYKNYLPWHVAFLPGEPPTSMPITVRRLGGAGLPLPRNIFLRRSLFVFDTRNVKLYPGIY
ncbi:hypothetical protein EDD15DRAFT_2193452 [Pisolithus albus]|nr:hypothetical protein EDD15DRAFT_2193452 [Pisolithus albus]